MVVRRYVVKDMPEAVLLIRKDLGKDAVILSTKRVTSKKWMGLWRTKRIEVLAAVGNDVPMRAAFVENKSSGDAQVPSTPAPRGETAEVPVDAAVSPTLDLPVLDGPSATAVEVLRMASQSLVSETSSTEPESETAVVTELERLWREIADMKKMLESALVKNGVWKTMVQHLINQGIHEEQVWSLVRDESEETSEDSLETEAEPETGLRSLREAFEQRILQRLKHLDVAEPIASTSRIVAFVGPTGVGKTTSIAKLAALHVLAGERKVGLVTADTFRIAAVEQLRTYAGILNVPLEVVYQASELPGAIERLSDCDLILLDTAGRNYMNDRYVDEVRSILQMIPVDETFLVLSMTSKPEDLDQLASLFCRMHVDKFLFTKLDETSTYGAILNLLFTHQKPVSYVTTGQNVPDDIEAASLEKLLKLILGGAA